MARKVTSNRVSITKNQNLVTYSQQMDDASYGLTAATASGNSAIAPDGTSTATTYTDTIANAQHYIRKPYGITTNSLTYTASVYVKAGTIHWFGMYADDSNTIAVFFDVLNGVIGTSLGGASASIISVGNGWYRCIVTFFKTVGTGNRFYMATADNTITYAGGTGTLLFWGNQYVQANYAGPYQLTTSSIVNTGPLRNMVNSRKAFSNRKTP